jgi:hypothetical protein
MMRAPGETDGTAPSAPIAEYLELFDQEFDGNSCEFEGVGHAISNRSGPFAGGYVPEILEPRRAGPVSGKPGGNPDPDKTADRVTE